MASNPVTIIRQTNLPLNELNQIRRCARCWHCCITADANVDWNRFYRDFELPIRWTLLQMSNPTVHICPFLGAEDGAPTCLIYNERPEMCVATFCKWMVKT